MDASSCRPSRPERFFNGRTVLAHTRRSIPSAVAGRGGLLQVRALEGRGAANNSARRDVFARSRGALPESFGRSLQPSAQPGLDTPQSSVKKSDASSARCMPRGPGRARALS